MDKAADRFDDIHLLLSTVIHEGIEDVGVYCGHFEFCPEITFR